MERVRQRVINFSGGQTSAYMTITEYQPGDIVLFCDTGREHPKTYKFINDFEANENIPIIRIAKEGGFDGVMKRRGYKTLPNRMRRYCTDDLKIKAAKQYLRSIGVREYNNLIGFRADEQRRVLSHKEKFKKVKTLFPLYEKGITKADVDHYFTAKTYRLEIPRVLGNCTLCFMKGKNVIISILKSDPSLAAPWIEDEEKNINGGTYLPGVTMKQLLTISQNTLFNSKDLQEMSPAYDCACTV